MLEAVFFDLFETVVTEFAPSFRPPRVSTAERLDIEDEVFWPERRKRDAARHCGVFPSYVAMLRDICQSLGVRPDEAVLAELESERIAEHVAPFTSVKGFVIEGLAALRERGVPMGIISNTSAEEVTAWDKCPLRAYFDDVVFSHEVGHVKPDPRIYLTACERLGVVPEHCIFVGDGGSDELAGAAAVGMTPYCATWFSSRFPEAIRETLSPTTTRGYPCLASPAELLPIIGAAL